MQYAKLGCYWLCIVFTAACENGLPIAPEAHQASTIATSWELVWQDEFNGIEIDKSKWSFEYNCYGGGNSEQQCYTDRNENAFVQQGLLHIVARLEDYAGPALKDDHADYSRADTSTVKPFTSARLRSVFKGDWLYGRFEVRAKFPKGQGTWGAVWMLPSDWVYGDWSSSGEIDIVEAINLGARSDRQGAVEGELETRIHGTLHYGQSWPDNVYSGRSYRLPSELSPADDFYRYAIEWEPNEIRWYVDGIHYATQTSDNWYSLYSSDDELRLAKGSAPFDQRFHLLLNLAVGGTWVENANNQDIDYSVFPQVFLIDYVRVYKNSSQS
ncbi:beta-glucanase [Shewanella sairae]|uniref:Beta-glucanase n=1 Tax=Shewanella sairae TaxID=190310 RepID=A0ABQ4PQS7_9GAMM|nr:glycoside hydrolase family 16 protein [Shewanella sairae]MCL1131385.1 glycoside hydrolase family 16 protein [Shewanella sairae]GIU51459.1 beta-glucanase [Shewanella sairae]